AHGGRVVGVIPQALVDKELAHRGLSELVVTSSMHERKAQMAARADAFVALPGGVGTLEEIFEMWTWAQLGFHDKPCGFLDAAGYYDDLVKFLDRAVSEGFVRPGHREMLIVERSPEALLDRFASYQPPLVEKWVGRGET
ncbi:MAG TPA: TIGR00730 family Rossman fold protein, partial [Polyangiaceae bacterium]|nr:TIGR00730 family Rossman fold protein [Polyangiaceae bacterium]